MANSLRIWIGSDRNECLLVAQRDPIQTAKQVASLDVISNGRFLFGIGGGWNREEMRNHGTDPRTRWKLMRESIEAMTEIWTNDIASYHGELVSFDQIISNPKPIQTPRPPVHIGAAFPNGMARAVRYGGYSREEANSRMSRNNGVVARFSRALTEGLTAQQSDDDFDAMLDASVASIFEASRT